MYTTTRNFRMIWIVILVLVMVAMACSIIYLTNRIGKIGFVRKISRENKKINKLFSIVLLAMIIAVATVFLNFVNAIIIILHLVVFWILCDLIGLIITKIRKKKFNTYYSWIFAVLITAIYLFIGWNQVNNVVETDYKLTTEKDIEPIRIVQFADSHVGTTFSGKGLEKYVSEINSKNPDVVVITGDFVDDDTSIDDMRDACKALSGLQTKFGVYYCFGNHDMGYYGKKNSSKADQGYSFYDHWGRHHRAVVFLPSSVFVPAGNKNPSAQLRGGKYQFT